MDKKISEFVGPIASITTYYTVLKDNSVLITTEQYNNLEEWKEREEKAIHELTSLYANDVLTHLSEKDVANLQREQERFLKTFESFNLLQRGACALAMLELMYFFGAAKQAELMSKRTSCKTQLASPVVSKDMPTSVWKEFVALLRRTNELKT